MACAIPAAMVMQTAIVAAASLFKEFMRMRITPWVALKK
jgi:hypothetical protein